MRLDFHSGKPEEMHSDLEPAAFRKKKTVRVLFLVHNFAGEMLYYGEDTGGFAERFVLLVMQTRVNKVNYRS